LIVPCIKGVLITCPGSKPFSEHKIRPETMSRNRYHANIPIIITTINAIITGKAAKFRNIIEQLQIINHSQTKSSKEGNTLIIVALIFLFLRSKGKCKEVNLKKEKRAIAKRSILKYVIV